MAINKIKKEVIELFKPYIRANSKIVYHCPSTDRWKAHIPKALIIEGNDVPHSASTELQMWHKLHQYLIGEEQVETLETLSVKWFEERAKDLDIKARTRRRNKNVWDKYYKNNPIIKIPLKKLTPRDVKAFYKSYTQGRQITRGELGNIKGIFNMMLSYAVDNNIVEINVAKVVDTRDLKCKKVNNSKKVYTRKERAALFSYLKSIPKNVYTLGIMLMFCLDIRIGELKALKWEDVDLETGQIYIHSQIVDAEDENGKWCQELCDYTKAQEESADSGGERWLPLSNTAKNVLLQLKMLCGSSEYILTNKAGTTIKTNKFNEHLQKYCTACGIRYLSSHKIRFYAVTEQAKLGKDLLEIQYNSGHKNKSTTEGYIRSVRNKEDAVVDDTWEQIFG
jgi:integrase